MKPIIDRLESQGVLYGMPRSEVQRYFDYNVPWQLLEVECNVLNLMAYEHIRYFGISFEDMINAHKLHQAFNQLCQYLLIEFEYLLKVHIVRCYSQTTLKKQHRIDKRWKNQRFNPPNNNFEFEPAIPLEFISFATIGELLEAYRLLCEVPIDSKLIEFDRSIIWLRNQIFHNKLTLVECQCNQATTKYNSVKFRGLTGLEQKLLLLNKKANPLRLVIELIDYIIFFHTLDSSSIDELIEFSTNLGQKCEQLLIYNQSEVLDYWIETYLSVINKKCQQVDQKTKLMTIKCTLEDILCSLEQ